VLTVEWVRGGPVYKKKYSCLRAKIGHLFGNILWRRTGMPGPVREHRADKAKEDIGNSARTKGCVLKTRRIPGAPSALLLVELFINGLLLEICHLSPC